MTIANLTHDYRRSAHRVAEPPLKNLDGAVHWCVGKYLRGEGRLKELQEQANQIDSISRQFVGLGMLALQERLHAFRDRFRRSPDPGAEVLVPAVAAIREAAHRCLGLRAFPVQLTGLLALHRGYLAEMATGEGKTLTAGLAAVLAGWTRRPVHIVTVNDYLAHRDATWLGPLYEFCGVTCGCVTSTLDPGARAREYGQDLTYTTSKELLADFLRDRLRFGTLQDPSRRLIRQLLRPRAVARDGLVMRGIHTAIVDEADSVLIDEAVTPLIISATRENKVLREVGVMAAQLAQDLKLGEDYGPNLRYKEIELTSAGRQKLAERCSSLPGFWRSEERRSELIRTALVAREFFLRDRQYIVSDGKVVIVDEFTGRPMPQRTWREGLHQAIEAKEGLAPSDPSETVARMSFQKFFRCFHRLSGMTGTAWETASEFWQIYRLPVVRIPTNRPCIRQRWPDRFFPTESAKWEAVVECVQEVHRTGRPILIGTRTVAASEELGRRLAAAGITPKILNAAHLSEEAAIIATAGQTGSITIATNMAGRGTDIRLGDGVPELGGLHVIATEHHESARVDRQLFGRAARQGDPGSAQAFASAQDELVRRHLPKLTHKVLFSVNQRWLAKMGFAVAQRGAQKLAKRQRVGVLRSDTWLDESLSFAGE